jgi:hypothetical protein
MVSTSYGYSQPSCCGNDWSSNAPDSSADSGATAMDPSGMSKAAADGLREVGIDPYKVMSLMVQPNGDDKDAERMTLIEKLEKIADDFQKFLDFLGLWMSGALDKWPGIPMDLALMLRKLGIDPEKFWDKLMGTDSSGEDGGGCCQGSGQDSGGSGEVNEWGIPLAIALEGGPQGGAGSGGESAQEAQDDGGIGQSCCGDAQEQESNNANREVCC